MMLLAVERGGFGCGSAVICNTGRTGGTSIKEAPADTYGKVEHVGK